MVVYRRSTGGGWLPNGRRIPTGVRYVVSVANSEGERFALLDPSYRPLFRGNKAECERYAQLYVASNPYHILH